MLRVAKRRMDSEANTYLSLGDATHLPFSNEGFDEVASIFTLEILNHEEHMATLKEVVRVHKRDGEFLTLSILDRPSRVIKLYKLLSKLSPTIFNCRSAKLDKILNQAGFRIIRKHEARLYSLPIMITIASKD